MPQKMYLINDPAFSEYVFNVMASASPEIKSKLNSRELLFFKNKITMKRFADRETLERRMLMLAQLEVPYCLLFGQPRDFEIVNSDIYTQYNYAEKKKAIIEAMAKKKLFVLSSNDVLVGMHMAAQNSHSRVYILNYDYVKINQKVAEAGLATVNQAANDAREGIEILARVALAAISKINSANAMTGIDPFSLKTLLALYPYMQTYIGIPKILELMDESERQKGIAKHMNSLEVQGYIRRLPGLDEDGINKKKYFTLAERGINTVMIYLKYLAKVGVYG
jgi:hypothetical protein